MVITGLNRFFAKHGRVAFFLIAVVISVSFVLYMSGINLIELIFARSQRPANMLLLGREITQDDRMNAVDRLLIQQSLLYPVVSLQGPDYSKLDPIAINNLMLFFAAEDRGIAIGNKEVADYLKSVPSFQTKGKFDIKKLNNYVEEKLNPRHFNKEDLDDAVRAQLVVEKLTNDITENVITPNEEIKEAFFNIQEKAKIMTAAFSAAEYAKNLEISDSEAEAYFNANMKKYMTPAAVKAQVVRFEYGMYKKEAWKEVTDKEVEKYYNENKELYVKKDVKKTAQKDVKDKKEKVEYTPLKDVADKIKNTLAAEKSKVLAAKAATDYSDDVYELTKDLFYAIKDSKKAHEKCQEVFAKFAKSKNVEIYETGWVFEGETKIKGLGDEPELAGSIARIFIDNPLSENIKGKNAAFVALLTGKKGPSPETFDKVKSKVKTDLKEIKSVQLAREAARAAALKIGEALDKGDKLTVISKKIKVKFASVPQQLVASQPLFMPNGGEIHKAAFETAAGKISSVINIDDGAILVFVVNKSFPTEKDFDAQKASFTQRYKMMKKQVVWRNFTSSLAVASGNVSKESNK